MFEEDIVHIDALILISANAEWEVVTRYFHEPETFTSPFGAYFSMTLANRKVLFFFGGWGKITSAAATQYGIDRWQPRLILNLGTCGGLAGRIKVGEVVLVEKTLVYDIYERMGDPEEAVGFYTTPLDLSFLQEPYPQAVTRGLLVSADQDIDPDLVHFLVEKYGANAADWESGAIAWTAARNQTPCLILRGVSDMVDPLGGEIYEDIDAFHNRAEPVMLSLLRALPNWIRCAFWGLKE